MIHIGIPQWFQSNLPLTQLQFALQRARGGVFNQETGVQSVPHWEDILPYRSTCVAITLNFGQTAKAHTYSGAHQIWTERGKEWREHVMHKPRLGIMF